MYLGFNLNVDLEFYDDYFRIGKRLHDENKKIVKDTLDSFKSENGKLKAEKIIAEWFPPISADVFLSHSHKDEPGIIALAGWLNHKFGLSCFIDSSLWGYSPELLRMIDNQYCYNKEKNTYNYDDRNKSTSHVYMMLSTALTRTMDSCECVFFVNTPNSIKIDETISSSGKTESPWIYSEIAMTKLIRRRDPRDHRAIKGLAMDGMESFKESLDIEYDVDLSHLKDIDKSTLDDWATEHEKKPLKYALDFLYAKKDHGAIYG